MSSTMQIRDAVLRVRQIGLPRVAWALGRSGAAGLIGVTLLSGSAIFLFSTQLPLGKDVGQLREELLVAQGEVARPASRQATVLPATPMAVPGRGDMPRLLGLLFQQADSAQLTIDTAKYEVSADPAGSLVRYRVSFPVDGPYSNVRAFLDSALKALPDLAVDQLDISRKSIAEGAVEAQLRITFFTRSEP